MTTRSTYAFPPCRSQPSRLEDRRLWQACLLAQKVTRAVGVVQEHERTIGHSVVDAADTMRQVEELFLAPEAAAGGAGR